MDASRPQPEIPLARIQILTDVIFASSMTIMALTIELPTGEILDERGLVDYLRGQLPSFAIYGVTFLLIAVYWLKHLEHFSYYRRTNQTHLWLQLLFLLFLVLIPFTNAVSTAFPDRPPVQLLYSLNMLAVGLFSFFAWTYATADHRLVDPALDADLIASVRAEALTEPAMAVASMVVLFVDPVLWELPFLLVPLAFMVRKRLRRRR